MKLLAKLNFLSFIIFFSLISNSMAISDQENIELLRKVKNIILADELITSINKLNNIYTKSGDRCDYCQRFIQYAETLKKNSNKFGHFYLKIHKKNSKKDPVGFGYAIKSTIIESRETALQTCENSRISIFKEKDFSCQLIIVDGEIIYDGLIERINFDQESDTIYYKEPGIFGSESYLYTLNKINDQKFENLYKTFLDSKPTPTLPEISNDKSPPIIVVEERVIINHGNYKIKGSIFDDSTAFIEVDGNSIPVTNDTFTIDGYAPIGSQKLEIIATDQWGNTTSKKITVIREADFEIDQDTFAELNPNSLRAKPNKNKIALVIGIEEYENISNANFAKQDAQLFIDYAQGAFGVPLNNIKYFLDENAKENSRFDIKKWFRKNINNNTEVYIYFSGHGMALNGGEELYLLTHDTIVEYIDETAINRNEIFNDITQYNPKSVTVFLDTCYSGAGRADGEMLLAMAKGLVVVDEQQQSLPDNFTLFTAASAQESAWSLPEAKHGTFSYFLMKGMEGNADLNGDKKITNGELRDYLLDNVGRYAQQRQTPQMVGDVNKILVTY